MSDRDELKKDVALMRLLGVVEWKGIRLGAPPVAEAAKPRARTPDELQAELAKQREARHRIQFAASKFVPPLQPAGEPATVAQGANGRVKGARNAPVRE